MGYSNQGRFRQQISFLRPQYLQDGDLPFTDVLSEQIVSQALTAAEVVWNDSIYQPLVTLWVFLSQKEEKDGSSGTFVAPFPSMRPREKFTLWHSTPVSRSD